MNRTMKKLMLLALMVLSIATSVVETLSKESTPFEFYWENKPEEISLIKAEKYKGTTE
ncbi:hypothetical protein ISO36_17095 [Morganella morganii subsp. morganii]|nr:hypothetical protein [Morganella morganii subsp. morganii]HDU8708530.1 hypothetical protein [Morganella morganii subsp. morganii]